MDFDVAVNCGSCARSNAMAAELPLPLLNRPVFVVTLRFLADRNDSRQKYGLEESSCLVKYQTRSTVS